MDIIKKLSRSIREYKMVSIMTPVCIVFEVIFEILIPFMMAKMIDSGISSGNESALVKYGTLLILCVMAGLVFGILSGGLCATASAGFAKNLRKDMYYKIQEYSFANIDKFSSSSIVTRLTTDVTNVQNAYMMIIRIAVRAPFMLIFALIAAFMTSTKLSLIFLIAILCPSRPTTLSVPSLISKSSPVIILLLSLIAIEKIVWLITSFNWNCESVIILSLIIAGR